jgi:hypothetical protein
VLRAGIRAQDDISNFVTSAVEDSKFGAKPGGDAGAGGTDAAARGGRVPDRASIAGKARGDKGSADPTMSLGGFFLFLRDMELFGEAGVCWSCGAVVVVVVVGGVAWCRASCAAVTACDAVDCGLAA